MSQTPGALTATDLLIAAALTEVHGPRHLAPLADRLTAASHALTTAEQEAPDDDA